MNDDYNYFLTPMGNRVWTCAMQLAWNQIINKFTNDENLTFNTTDKLQNKMIDNYNKRLFTSDSLSDSSYYINSGFGNQTLNQINRQVREKFPLKTF